jgi:pheromone shutdown protein TraB
LAKELNHQKVYGVDAEGLFDIGRVFAFAGANNQQEIVDRGIAIGKRQVAETNKLTQTAAIREIYKAINDQRRINESHQAYMMMSRVGKGKEYPGVDLLADWYERNLKIFSNINRITESKDDRILVIIGGGHVKMLQQFVEDSGEYNLERSSKYF